MDSLRTRRTAARGPLMLATAAFALASAAGAAANSDPAMVCTGGLAIGISLDGSGSVQLAPFNQLKQQVADFIDTTSGFSTGAVNDNIYYVNVWATTLEETTGDFEVNAAGDVSAAVGGLTFPSGGSTNIAVGLMDLKDQFAMLPPGSGASIAILFTDGESNAGDTGAAAAELRAQNVAVAAVGVGNGFDVDELNLIASTGMNGNKLVFSSNNFAGIQTLLEDVIASIDTDGDGVSDCMDGCPEDPEKTEPGVCGCGEPETCKKAKLLKFKKFAKYGPGKHFIGGHKKIIVKKSPPRSHRFRKFHNRSNKFSKFHNRSHRGSKYSAW